MSFLGNPRAALIGGHRNFEEARPARPCDNRRMKTPTPAGKVPVSDAAVEKATGRDWAEWCRVLDREGAHTMAHAEIASLVADKFNGGPWWSQTVTVGYERIKGLRALHQKPGGFEIGRSKTIPAPIARVYKAWHSAAARRKWLANPDITISAANENKTLRFIWIDGKSRAQTYFVDKGGKTAVTVQHGKLADAKAAARMKKYWGAQLDRLAGHLAAAR
jgi:uncharacterized protein YndB with AHSA1/START domain